METNTITQFNTGDVFTSRAASNYDCIYQWTVVGRTAKFVTVRDQFGDTKRAGVKVCAMTGSEYCYPNGSYAWAPMIYASNANKPVATCGRTHND